MQRKFSRENPASTSNLAALRKLAKRKGKASIVFQDTQDNIRAALQARLLKRQRKSTATKAQRSKTNKSKLTH